MWERIAVRKLDAGLPRGIFRFCRGLDVRKIVRERKEGTNLVKDKTKKNEGSRESNQHVRL